MSQCKGSSCVIYRKLTYIYHYYIMSALPQLCLSNDNFTITMPALPSLQIFYHHYGSLKSWADFMPALPLICQLCHHILFIPSLCQQLYHHCQFYHHHACFTISDYHWYAYLPALSPLPSLDHNASITINIDSVCIIISIKAFQHAVCFTIAWSQFQLYHHYASFTITKSALPSLCQLYHCYVNFTIAMQVCGPGAMEFRHHIAECHNVWITITLQTIDLLVKL